MNKLKSETEAGNGKEDVTDEQVLGQQAPDWGNDPHAASASPAEVGLSVSQTALSRRRFLGAGSATLAAAMLVAGPLDAQVPPVAEVAAAEKDASASDPGPKNGPLSAQNPDSVTPPPTDHGDVPTFWYSFALAHRRTQEGGWARQVNVKDLPIAKEIAGVDMRLTAGGVRELHWHQAGEWAIMLSGNARLTVLDAEGRGYVNDIVQNDLWYFPAGIPHSIQGLEPDGCEFLLVFDDGTFSEYGTSLLCDWVAHLPKEVLAKNFGLPESALADLPKAERYIFQASLPGPLAADKQAAAAGGQPSPTAFSFPLHTMSPTYKTRGGEVRIIDSRNFPISTTIAAAHVVVHPGAMRELHWHPNADEWQYYIQGSGRMTVFANSGDARTMDFNAGDIGYVQKTLGHYIENTGSTDLIFLETFKSDHYQDLSLSEWLKHTPPALVQQHLDLSSGALAAIPTAEKFVVPG